MKQISELKIIFFDGVCELCNSSVDFILKTNIKRNLKIASLQGIKAQKFLDNNDLKNLNTIILYTESKKYYKSDAIIEISKDLVFPINLIQHFAFIPKVIRDLIYDFISQNRYKWYGKRNKCRLPTKSEKDRFLE